MSIGRKDYMSQLIQMNQRINAIETIKKITHATRLIAMSAHTRLAHKEPSLKNYKQEVSKLFSHLASCQSKPISFFSPNEKAEGSLIILVGSQKGFCGTFNLALFKFFELKLKTLTKNDAIITIGKKATDYLIKKKTVALETFSNLSSATLNNITKLLTETILKNLPHYKKILIVNNEPISFFLQKPHITQILPAHTPDSKKAYNLDSYVWPESQLEVLNHLGKLYLTATIQSLLFSSLVAEQAARFHSMDNATRNAKDLLDVMRRDYNKLRQSKITQELIELTSGFER